MMSKVKHVGRGGMVISCNSNADAKKFREMAESNLSEKYVIKEIKGLHP